MRPLIPLGATFAMLALAACGTADTSPMTIEDTRQVADHDQRLGASNAERFGGMGPTAPPTDTAPPPPSSGAAPYRLPEGWTELPPTGMRPINLRTASGAECYVTVTTGGAAAVRSNVDRWRKQLGLEPITDAAYAALERAPLLGGDALLVEAEGSFTGMGGGEARGGWAIHGLVLARADRVITLKLVGPAAAVAADHADMLAFAASLGATTEEPPASQSADDGYAYDLPEGWTALPPRTMRDINLRSTGGAECYLTLTTGGEAALRGNVDRWRAQVGLGPINDADYAALERAPLLGGQAMVVTAEGSFTGMGGGEAQPGWAIHGLVMARDDQVLTLKLVGPAAVVAADHAAMLALAASLREGDE